MAETLEDIRVAIAAVAMARGLDYVIQAESRPELQADADPNQVLAAANRSVLYANPRNDITEEVIREVNRRFEAADELPARRSLAGSRRRSGWSGPVLQGPCPIRSPRERALHGDLADTSRIWYSAGETPSTFFEVSSRARRIPARNGKGCSSWAKSSLERHQPVPPGSPRRRHARGAARFTGDGGGAEAHAAAVRPRSGADRLRRIRWAGRPRGRLASDRGVRDAREDPRRRYDGRGGPPGRRSTAQDAARRHVDRGRRDRPPGPPRPSRLRDGPASASRRRLLVDGRAQPSRAPGARAVRSPHPAAAGSRSAGTAPDARAPSRPRHPPGREECGAGARQRPGFQPPRGEARSTGPGGPLALVVVRWRRPGALTCVPSTTFEIAPGPRRRSPSPNSTRATSRPSSTSRKASSRMSRPTRPTPPRWPRGATSRASNPTGCSSSTPARRRTLRRSARESGFRQASPGSSRAGYRRRSGRASWARCRPIVFCRHPRPLLECHRRRPVFLVRNTPSNNPPPRA